MWTAFLDGFSVLSEKFVLVSGAVCVTCLGCSPIFFLSREFFRESGKFRRSFLLPGIFFTLSVILRLAVLTETYVPPYFDSVEHFRLVKGLVTALEASTFLESVPALTPSYYHLGFHFLASFLTIGLRADPIDVILVLGQVILAAIPLPIYFFLLRATKSVAAAFFGMFLAGFGWYMPGFAVNWGKYPALAGLLSLEITLIFAYYLSENWPNRRARIIPVGLFILGIIVSTMFHTRALAIIVIAVLSWLLASRISTLSRMYQVQILFFLLTGMLALGWSVQQEPLLNLALDPYLSDGLWVTSAMVALAPIAFLRFRRGLYFCVLFILCILVALFVPIGIRLPGLENQTILDRPFVEIALYLPLSVLGGLGLAGLLQFMDTLQGFPEKLHRHTRILTIILLVGFIGLISTERYNFYPSVCCNLVDYDDTIAIDWLDRNLPLDAHILVAATPMSVLPARPSAELVGTDAGIWIPSLAGREIILAPFDTDFRTKSTIEGLCQKQVGYIYAGGKEQKFNTAQLNGIPGWYDRILFLPKAQLYKVIGCS
jgi:hypothetical protein